MAEIHIVKPSDWEVLRELLGEGHAEFRKASGATFGSAVPSSEESIKWLAASSPEGIFGIYEDDALLGACCAHLEGREGWIGPLAVTLAAQGSNFGRKLIEHAIPYLLNKSAATIGIEGPPAPAVLGFLGKIGFSPSAMTLTLDIPVTSLSEEMNFWVDPYSAVPESRLAEVEAGVKKFVNQAAPGRDYMPLVKATKETKLGESFVFSEGEEITGLAVVHNFSSYPGEGEDAVVVRKLVCHIKKNVGRLDQVLAAIGAFARAQNKKHIRLRCLSDDPVTYQYLLSRGFRVHDARVRLTLEGYPEVRHGGYVVFSNWGLS